MLIIIYSKIHDLLVPQIDSVPWNTWKYKLVYLKKQQNPQKTKKKPLLWPHVFGKGCIYYPLLEGHQCTLTV